ncbi:MAG: integrase family protein [Gammaproteobacteria bacterium]|nr:integrase family protein [Gammaproteobacteria bacterium]
MFLELTENLIKELIPPKPATDGRGRQAFYRDSRLTGFAVRISSGGTKSYILERRIRGKVKRITLGRCEKMSFNKAQARAKKLISEVERENAPRIINGKIVDEEISLLTAYYDYLDTHKDLNASTLADYQRSIDGPLHDWHAIPVREIDSHLIVEKHKEIGQHHPARSNNAMRLLRAVLNYVQWHMRTVDHHPILKQNPVDILNKRGLWYAINASSKPRGFASEQLKQWWQASLSLKKATTRKYLHFLLLTGYPPSIVSGLRYKDIDYDKKLLIYKQGDYSEIPLCLPVCKYLCDELYSRPERVFNDSQHIFPGLNGKPISDPRTAIKKIQSASDISFGLKDLHWAFMEFAKLTQLHTPKLHLLSDVYKGKKVIVSDQDNLELREIQERVFLNMFFIIGTIKS